MFDPDKIRKGEEITVGQLINELSKENFNSKIYICGSNTCIIHVDKESGNIVLDNDELSDSYPEEVQDKLFDNIPIIEPIIFTKQGEF